MNIEDPALKAVVVKAIYDSIPATTREKMLTDAVVALMTPPKGDSYYGPKPVSKLAEIFEHEVYAFARTAVKDSFETDPKIQEAVKALCVGALNKLLTDETLITGLASLISGSIKNAQDAVRNR